MVALTTQSTQAPIGGVDNASLTSAYLAFEATLWPPHFSQIRRVAAALLASHFPVVAAAARSISTQVARSYADDFYYRVHVTPQSLDLGNVVSTQTTTVRIWNAHFEPRTLDTIDGAAEGIVIGGQPSPPLLVQPLAELRYDVSVTPDGQPTLDTTIAWTFDNAEAPGLRITANRIIAWAFAPDWADGVRERLEWLTEVLQSESMAEQRTAQRIAPRRTFSAPVMVDGRERQLLDLQLFDWGARIWALPIWPDIQLLATPIALGATRINCQTADLDFVEGGLAMLQGETAFALEVVQILAIDVAGLDLQRGTQQAWPAGTRLYPARSAQLTEEPSRTRLTDMAESLDVSFLVMDACDWPEVMPTTLYRGWPVLESRPDESEDLTNQYARLLSTLDSGYALPRSTDFAGRAMPVRAWRWLDLGRAERGALRSLLYALRGQQKALWIPTHADDLTLVDIALSTATTLDIAYCGYTRFAQAKAGRRDIRIELRSGAAYHRRITGSTEITADIERLSIDSALGVAIAPADVLRISWMTLSRGNDDAVEIDHITDSEGVASCELTFRGVRDDDI